MIKARYIVPIYGHSLLCCGNDLGVLEMKVDFELTQISTWLKIN